jgi:RimJ/RimL family protein N-acetyltransferase
MQVTPKSVVPTIDLSDVDEDRFGYRTAKAAHVTRDGLPGVLAYCREHHIQLLIARCLADDMPAAQAMEQAGFQLMDTLVYYACNPLERLQPMQNGRISIRAVMEGEEDAVTEVARDAFHGYRFGHYHADPRLDRSACDAVYPSWARALCTTRDAAREVLVADNNCAIVGFIGLRLNDPSEGEGILNGVLRAEQGQGVYTFLLAAGLEWCRQRGAHRFLISTQLANWRVQRVWARLGLALADAQYTFHKWFT